MNKPALALLICGLFFFGLAYPQNMKDQQKELARLQNKLRRVKSKKEKVVIIDKIAAIKQKIAKPKKPAALRKRPALMPLSTFEALPEESELLAQTQGRIAKSKKNVRLEIGGAMGMFAGTSAYLLEARIPLRMVLGPTTPSIRLFAGLSQHRETNRKYLPLGLDLIFNFPPGWFTGVENYIGGGLNYVVRASGGEAGALRGEVFYGVQSDGLGGVMAGEIGYAALRSGSLASDKGITVLIGYRAVIGF